MTGSTSCRSMSRTSSLKPVEMGCCCLPAGQSVLEGLNALLDHRAEVYIPELAQAFACPPSFRVFAAQNPVQEGGGRRGLPQSFLNRFTRVHVELLRSEDLQFISGAWACCMRNPSLARQLWFAVHSLLSTQHSSASSSAMA